MRRVLLVSSLFVVSLVAFPGTSAADPPANSPGVVWRGEVWGIWNVIADPASGLLAFVNVDSIEDACNGIPAGPVPWQGEYLPNYVLVQRFEAIVPVIIAPLGEEEEVCSGPWPVIATGEATYRGNANDNWSGTRVKTTTVGVHGSELTDGLGQWWNLDAGFIYQWNQEGYLTMLDQKVHLIAR